MYLLVLAFRRWRYERPSASDEMGSFDSMILI
jgi:hypothetical protein